MKFADLLLLLPLSWQGLSAWDMGPRSLGAAMLVMVDDFHDQDLSKRLAAVLAEATDGRAAHFSLAVPGGPVWTFRLFPLGADDVDIRPLRDVLVNVASVLRHKGPLQWREMARTVRSWNRARRRSPDRLSAKQLGTALKQFVDQFPEGADNGEVLSNCAFLASFLVLVHDTDTHFARLTCLDATVGDRDIGSFVLEAVRDDG